MEIQIFNSEPMYLRLDNLISDDLIERLKFLVDEYGTVSSYTGNKNCLELRMEINGNRSGIGVAKDPAIAIAVAELNRTIYPLQDIISKLFTNTACDFITGHNGFWLMRYDEGGCFESHVDYSGDDDEHSTPAVYTLCVRLNDDFEDGKVHLSGVEISAPPGTGVVWDGWTYHEVEPVTKGSRYMLVVHFLGQLKD